jgi:hypothetical protein
MKVYFLKKLVTVFALEHPSTQAGAAFIQLTGTHSVGFLLSFIILFLNRRRERDSQGLLCRY